MNITFRQMRYFIAVAEIRSISGGAVSVGISQSAVTDAIRFIEAELGCDMFARHARGVILTREGEQFLRHARKIVDAMNDIRGGLGRDSPNVTGRLMVGATPTVTGYFMPDLLARYRQAFPAVEVAIVEERSDYIEHLLVNGELDLAILILPGLTRPEALDQDILLRSDMRVWLAPAHRLADHDSISLAELADEPLIDINREELQAVSQAVWQRQPVHRRPAYRSASVEAIRGLVGGLKLVGLPGRVGEEQLLASDLVAGNGLLSFRRNHPGNKGIARHLLHVRVLRRVHKHDPVLVEELRIALDEDRELATVPERQPCAAVG